MAVIFGPKPLTPEYLVERHKLRFKRWNLEKSHEASAQRTEPSQFDASRESVRLSPASAHHSSGMSSRRARLRTIRCIPPIPPNLIISNGSSVLPECAATSAYDRRPPRVREKRVRVFWSISSSSSPSVSEFSHPDSHCGSKVTASSISGPVREVLEEPVGAL